MHLFSKQRRQRQHKILKVVSGEHQNDMVEGEIVFLIFFCEKISPNPLSMFFINHTSKEIRSIIYTITQQIKYIK